MGHATRCVPIIELLSENNRVILGVSDVNRLFFEDHFPLLQKINMPTYGIRYSKRFPLLLKLILQVPNVLRVLKNENTLLKTLIAHHHINLVISDNRFGCFSKTVKSIFITHQLNLQAPFISGLANAINRYCIQHFNEIWVPDYQEAERRLSGKLSDSSRIKTPVHFIGPQSALQKYTKSDPPERKETLILLSGLEPQRSILENKLIQALGGNTKNIILVRGSEKPLVGIPSGIEVHNFVYGQKLAELIVQSNRVICRSGYSTLMDLHVLGKKDLVLIPTPGQSEQEYLAEYWAQKFKARVYTQTEITKGVF